MNAYRPRAYVPESSGPRPLDLGTLARLARALGVPAVRWRPELQRFEVLA